MKINVTDTESLPTDIDVLHQIIKQQSEENRQHLVTIQQDKTALAQSDEELKKQARELNRKIEKLEKEHNRIIQKLENELRRYKDHYFCQRSEKYNQLYLFQDTEPLKLNKQDQLEKGDDQADQDLAIGSRAEKDALPSDEGRMQKIKSEKKKPARKAISTKDFTVIEEEVELKEEECVCDVCDSPLEVFSEDRSEYYEYIPASIVVKQTVRSKYKCPHCKEGAGTIKTPQLPSQPINKGNAGSGLLTDILVSKYEDHLPIYRIQRIYSRHGLDMSYSTLNDWVMKCAELLKPITEHMLEQLLESPYIFTDDTTVPVQQGKGKTKTGRIWAYVGGKDYPYTYYDYSPTRQGKYPQKILKEYRGYVHADAYSGYESLFTPKLGDIPYAYHVGCWAHMRRKFREALGPKPYFSKASEAIEKIKEIYEIENEARDMKPEDRCAYRHKHLKDLVDSFGKWLEENKDDESNFAFQTAITYAWNQWNTLTTFLDDGNLEMDNNTAEQAMRPIAIGRKNWMFAGNDTAAERAAVIQSLIATCRQNEVSPYQYLHDALMVMAQGRDEGRIDEVKSFTPVVWKMLKKSRDDTEK